MSVTRERVNVPEWLKDPVPLSGRPSPGPWLWLGTHQVHWLGTAGVPLFISRRRLERLKWTSWPTACAPWALDSGGFSELAVSKEHAWSLTARQYVDTLRRASEAIGSLAWAAPMDWMCEPGVVDAVARSGSAARALGRSSPRGVLDHLVLTVRNFVELRGMLDRPDDPLVIPVVQGWTLDDYETCLALYDAAGVDLTAEPLVGVGSVCRRDASPAILAKLAWIGESGMPRLHGFGVKGSVLTLAGHRLASADSLAWSYAARRAGRPTVPGHEGRHVHCGNCLDAALAWRKRTLERTAENTRVLREALATVESWVEKGVWDDPWGATA